MVKPVIVEIGFHFNALDAEQEATTQALLRRLS
jgi:hypothetical protein